MQVRLGSAAACLLMLAACVEDGAWYTPAGVPLGEIDCTSPAPLSGPSGREICLARVIEETPGEIQRCERDGGKVGAVSVVDRRFACKYREGSRAGGLD
ncbi:MAG: hypothetical protein JNK19_09765 [Tabrizicola sp.]|nr:hypothetical protein [Tabrizicola sp.]